MVTVESFTTGERIEVYIFAKPTSTGPAETSCDRVEGDHGCSFASEIDGKPYCRAITQEGKPEDRFITFGEIRNRSPLCRPGLDRSSHTITVTPSSLSDLNPSKPRLLKRI